MVKKLAHSGFEEDLAKLKEEFRAEAESVIEQIRAGNRARENLQSLVMSNFSASHEIAQERRLDAVGIAWVAIQKYRESIPWYIWAVDAVGYKEKYFGPNLIPLLKKGDYLSALAPTREIDEPVTSQRPFLGDDLFTLSRLGGPRKNNDHDSQRSTHAARSARQPEDARAEHQARRGRDSVRSPAWRSS